MKILWSLIVVLYFLEEFQARSVPTKEIYTADATECQYSPYDLICNLTGLDKQYTIHVTEKNTNSTVNLTIIGASVVKLTEASKNYHEINIVNCSDVQANDSLNSSYKLILQNSNASNINETVKYFKSKSSHIKTLVLRNTEEFDIVECEIDTLVAKSYSRTPKIISSNINTLDLEITGDSYLNINDSNIQVVKNLYYESSKESECVNSALQYIEKNSVKILKGQLNFRNIKLRAASQSFRIKNGTLAFDNIPTGLSSDNVILEPHGSFLLKSRDSNRVFTMNFKIEQVLNNDKNNSNTFFPLEKVMLRDNTLGISLSVLGTVIILMIPLCVYILYKKCVKNPQNGKIFDDLMSNKNEKEEINKKSGREYVRRDEDLNNENKNNEKIDYNERRVVESRDQSDSQVSTSQNKFSVANKETDILFSKDKTLFEDTEEEYCEPDILCQGEPDIYSDVELQGSPNNIEIYSENNYPSEMNHKLDNNPIINPNLDKFSSNDLIYSENTYPSGRVNEMKEHLQKVGFNNAQLYNPYQRPKQINTNIQIDNNAMKLFPKSTNNNYDPNSQIGKPNTPNVSFLSRNKDHIGKLEPPNILPPVKPLITQNFLLNKSHPPAPISKRSPKPTTTQPNLPVQNIEEENYYEEYNEN
ncbi:UNVERIFIED_CONTAM: hypothetical protein RMT77_012626 [Armadillidium vulgare]